MLPPRWQLVRAFFDVLMAPLLAREGNGCFAVEHNGPDGRPWLAVCPRYVDLAGDDPALEATRAVGRMCGVTKENLDPAPGRQNECGVYYSPALLSSHKRDDHHVIALAGIVLDIDDKAVGGRPGCVAALSRVPEPSFVVHSGGGIQVGYVLREALEFDRTDDDALRSHVYSYLRAANALGCLTGADNTHWPSHLFRCPGAYHLKQPKRPVLVTCELHPDRRFNLSDFDDLTGASNERTIEFNAAQLLARLWGEPTRARRRTITPPPMVEGVVRLPRRVSADMRQLLTYGVHSKYCHADGTLDRSRATFAAAISLLGAGLNIDQVLSALSVSALRPAMDDRGGYGHDWIVGQVTKASAYLTSQGVLR